MISSGIATSQRHRALPFKTVTPATRRIVVFTNAGFIDAAVSIWQPTPPS
ncbi:hypothetical protein [Propionibacterium sp.]